MAIPSSSGIYVGEHRDGYFWNGTSWEPGQATASTPAPAPFGGAIINQQNAAPAPAPAPAPTPAASTPAARRASILSTIMRIESGGQNIPQRINDINMRNGDPAQGYYQIIGNTWREFGGDKTGHKSALDAPYPVQLQVAQNIPVNRWGPATQEALKSAGYVPLPGETLGQMLLRYNEDPSATKPEDVGGSSAGGTAVAAAPATPTAGLLTPTPSAPVDTSAATAEKEKQKAEEDLYAGLSKTGMGLLQKATPEVADFAPPQMTGGYKPDPSRYPLPNYRPQQGTDPFLEQMMRQRLQRRV